jgi:pimeloyl-ACP methyl ester carboxylesterase
MPSFAHDGLSFNYLDSGSGTPFVFQHGLGADVNQPFSLFRPPAGFRLLAFDARAHGETRPIGDETKIGLAAFADDLLFFLYYLAIDKAIVGGISMGSAVALNFTLRYPERVLGLVLSRPAWLDKPKLENVQWTTLMARLIRTHGADRGKQMFVQSLEYAQLLRESPSVAEGLARQFDNPRVEETVARIERIPPDSPCRSLAELKAIRVPTLVLANRQDPVHPFEYGQILSEAIPGATFRELTPKSVSPERHAADVQTHLGAFLARHFAGS